MLDYSKISFNELDNDAFPTMAFFNYDALENEIAELVENYASEDEVPKGTEITNIELGLSIFSSHDFKLEAFCNDNYSFELDKQFSNADELIAMIPDYGKIRIQNMPQA